MSGKIWYPNNVMHSGRLRHKPALGKWVLANWVQSPGNTEQYLGKWEYFVLQWPMKPVPSPPLHTVPIGHISTTEFLARGLSTFTFSFLDYFRWHLLALQFVLSESDLIQGSQALLGPDMCFWCHWCAPGFRDFAHRSAPNFRVVLFHVCFMCAIVFSFWASGFCFVEQGSVIDIKLTSSYF